MNGDKNGAHEWLVEFKTAPEHLDEFAAILDESLKNINSDYEAKRHKDMTLAMPKVHQAKNGLFYKWLKQNEKLGGQHKVPRLGNKRDFLEELLGMSV